METQPLTHGAVERRPLGLALIILGKHEPRVVALREDRSLVLGRESPADVVIEDESLSRQHAEIWIRDGAVRIRDLGSRNGTRVGGEPVTGQDARWVRPGEEIRLGKVTLILHQPGDPGSVSQLVSYEEFVDRTEEELRRAELTGQTLELVLLSGGERLSVLCQRLQPFERATEYGRAEVLMLWPASTPEDGALRAAALANEADARAAIVTSGKRATASALIEACEEALRQAPAHERLSRATPASWRRPTAGTVPSVIAKSAPMQRVLELCARLAQSPLPIVLSGPTGSGKEVVAQFIHASSPRRSSAFLALNCATVTQSLINSELFGHVRGAFSGADSDRAGIFEAAAGGTVFLDEIAELSPEAQAALLRVLDTSKVRRVGATLEQPVEFRLLAASHADLAERVRAGKFREDLYYRISGELVRVPSLAERPEDILALARGFLAEVGAELEGPAAELLLAYPWPGNVRELRQCMNRALAVRDGDTVRAEDLPERVRASGTLRVTPRPQQATDLREAVMEFERTLIRRALEEHGGRRAEAARALCVPERTLSYRMKVLGLIGP